MRAKPPASSVGTLVHPVRACVPTTKLQSISAIALGPPLSTTLQLFTSYSSQPLALLPVGSPSPPTAPHSSPPTSPQKNGCPSKHPSTRVRRHPSQTQTLSTALQSSPATKSQIPPGPNLPPLSTKPSRPESPLPSISLPSEQPALSKAAAALPRCPVPHFP